jgi:photosystem II stability/assembly factor-like uncharacterized protein
MSSTRFVPRQALGAILMAGALALAAACGRQDEVAGGEPPVALSPTHHEWERIRVTIDPATASLTTGGTQQFTATVSGTWHKTVTWSVQEGAAGGTVTSGGLYSAPSAAGTYHVVATSPTSGTSGTAPVTVTATGTVPATGAGWMVQTSGTTSGLNGVSFVDANTGTAVGAGGTIVHTTDGGSTWTAQTSGTTSNLFGVSFVDASSGTAVGDNGTILHTADGGTTWTAQTSGTTNGLYGVSFVDANTGTAVGSSGTIVHTTDGGSTWTAQTSGTLTVLVGVSFVDRNTGTAVGGDGVDAAIILRTADGGATWTPQAPGAFPQVALAGVSFVDANTGMAVGQYICSDACGYTYATILRTTDGGATWTHANDNAVQDLVASPSALDGASLQDASTATVVGMYLDSGCGCYFGLIARTTDAGASWTLQDSGNQVEGLTGVSFVGAEVGTAVGGLGTILRTTTGGL